MAASTSAANSRVEYQFDEVTQQCVCVCVFAGLQGGTDERFDFASGLLLAVMIL